MAEQNKELDDYMLSMLDDNWPAGLGSFIKFDIIAGRLISIDNDSFSGRVHVRYLNIDGDFGTLYCTPDNDENRLMCIGLIKGAAKDKAMEL